MSIKVRFAPSPTGYLHIGGLRTALYNYLYAKKVGGKIILRIEDTDQARKVNDAVENLLDLFYRLNINFDEGPNNSGDNSPYYQSQRLSIYNDHIKILLENRSAYPCFCSSERLDTLRKKLVEAMSVVDKFGTDARSINRTLENIKDPEQVEKAIKEDVDKIKVLNK